MSEGLAVSPSQRLSVNESMPEDDSPPISGIYRCMMHTVNNGKHLLGFCSVERLNGKIVALPDLVHASSSPGRMYLRFPLRIKGFLPADNACLCQETSDVSSSSCSMIAGGICKLFPRRSALTRARMSGVTGKCSFLALPTSSISEDMVL